MILLSVYSECKVSINDNIATLRLCILQTETNKTRFIIINQYSFDIILCNKNILYFKEIIFEFCVNITWIGKITGTLMFHTSEMPIKSGDNQVHE